MVMIPKKDEQIQEADMDLLTYLKSGPLKYDMDKNNPLHDKFLEKLVSIKFNDRLLISISSSRKNEGMQELSREETIKTIYRGLAQFHLRRIKDESSFNNAVIKATSSLTKGGMISG